LQVISLAIAVVDKYKVVKGAVQSGVDRGCHLVRGGGRGLFGQMKRLERLTLKHVLKLGFAPN
jgi:hypothetical protein